MTSPTTTPPPADFYIAGASKSGTTSLFQVMRGHPQLFFPINKEPHFHSWGQDTSPESSALALHFSIHTPTTPDRYHRLFNDAQPGQLRGDASTSYLSHPHAAERIAASRPDARFIFILRNPVERAYSAYRHFRRDDLEPATTLAAALADASSPEAAQRKAYYLDHGLYAEQLQRYFNHFPKSQIRIFLYEELTQQTQSVLQEIYRFLHVNDSPAPTSLPKLNRSGSPRFTWLRDLLGQRTWIHDALRNTLPHSCRSLIRQSLEFINTVPARHSPQEDSPQLAQYYRDDLKRLATLIEKNIDHWTAPKASATHQP